MLYRNNQSTIFLSLLIVVVLIGLFSAAVALKPSWIIGSDGFSYYVYARSLIFDHDFDFTNEMRMFDRQFGLEISASWLTKEGKIGNPFAIGSSILWFPFVVSACAIQKIFKFSDS